MTTTTAAPRPVLPACAVLAGTLTSLIGLTWDIQWHADVGPDTFFTLPHLFLYSGSAVAGVASLAVVLAVTGAQRSGRPVDPTLGGPHVRVFGGAFAAPVGYLLAGTGAASFLLYGLWDLWWHDLYGFDAVVESPPHIGLLLSILITMLGAVVVFAAATPRRWAAVGTVVGLAVVLAFGVVTVIGLVVLGQVAFGAGTVFLAVLVVLVGRRALAVPGGAVAVAAVVAAWQGFSWWFSPWAARWYADQVGLPVRDHADGLPEMPALLPLVLLPVALVAEGVWWALRSRIERAGLAAGAVAGLLIAAAAPVQDALLDQGELPGLGEYLVTVLVGGVAGAAAGVVAVRLGGLLRVVAAAAPEARDTAVSR
jgi:hypothetical protein